MVRNIKLAVAAIALAGVGALAYADINPTTATAAVNAKAPMSLAVTNAEKIANGKAVNAKFREDEKIVGLWTYKVEVLSGTKVFDVTVDGNTGLVISSVEDLPDQGESEDDKDGDQDVNKDGNKKDGDD
jgi:uncharacterized membrane protein YkoI